MRSVRPARTWRVNWPKGHNPPKVDDVVHRFTPTQQDAGYYKVTSVRVIDHRKPLPPGFDTAYRVGYEYIGDEHRPANWCLYNHARPAKRENGSNWPA